jgi:NodT family efflux transporter outer membrane factor (OMF) lipoprotein
MTILFLSGCASVGPDYVPPDISVPPTWHNPQEGLLKANETDALDLTRWWSALKDPVLSNLMERAVAGNLDLKEARARVREARAQRGAAKTDFYPTLDLSGKINRIKTESDETGDGNHRTSYIMNWDAGWELDIFGGVRRSVEAAEAELEATRENLRDVLISLLGEVALNYLEVRTFQIRIGVAKANLAAQTETYSLTRVKYQAGLSDELAVQQARYNLENTRSQIPTLRTGLEAAKNRLAVLLGEHPGAVHEELKDGTSLPVVPLKIAVGVPADALRRRPDVRRAERELAAQTARVGVATAELYPKFTLSGSIGFEALNTGRLFNAGSRTIRFGPGVSWRIFEAGAVRRNIEVRSALQEQALARYEAAILGALEEVENALVALAAEQQRRDALVDATRAARSASELAQVKYQEGLIDFSEILDAQRSQLSFQDQLARSEGTVISNLVRLYKALGGGWSSLAPENQYQS